MALLPKKRTEQETWNPLPAFRREMDRLFEDFFGRRDTAMPSLFREEGWLPAIDLSETDNEVTVKAEVPGLTPEDIEVSLADNVLTLSGEKKSETEDKGRNYHRVERSYGRFVRSVALPAGAEGEKAKADYKNGVLTITMPKKAEARAKKIEVKGK